MLSDETLSIASANGMIGGEQEQPFDTFEAMEIPTCIHHDSITKLVLGMTADGHDALPKSRQICLLINKYLEEPFLLDPHLPTWVNRVVDWICARAPDSGESWVELVAAARVLYNFCKVRGPKTIMLNFRHEVEDVVPLLSLSWKLFSDPPSAEEVEEEAYDDLWMLRYISILMSSVALLVPFPLEKFANRLQSAGLPTDLFEQVYTRMLGRLPIPGRERQAAVIYISTLFRRKEYYSRLPDFISRCTESLDLGHLECLVAITRKIQDEDLSPYQAGLLTLMGKLDKVANPGQSLRVCRIKLYARQAEYARSARSPTIPESNGSRNLEAIFAALDDVDLVVRSMGAKQLAKVLSKLGNVQLQGSIAEKIIATLQQNFAALLYPDPSTTHGLVMALAEITRKRLFPQELIPVLLDLTCQYLLRFEVPRGRYALGSAVRDGACYILWGLCRCFNSSILQSVMARGLDSSLQTLSSCLLCMALFDREVSCRRAAAAAMQEIVGRWEGIPDGIALISAVNFFTIHHRRVTFGETCVSILSTCPRYERPVLEFLFQQSITSWDRETRQLAAPLCALLLGRLASESLGFCNEKLQFLLTAALNLDDLAAQHGALLALAEFLKTSHLVDETLRAEFFRTSTILTGDPPLVPAKMLGWEMVASAVCTLIAALAANPALTTDLPPDVSQAWLRSCSLALCSRDDNLHQVAATQTLPAIVKLYAAEDPLLAEYFRASVLPAADKDRNVNAQRGYTLAIGAFPAWLYLDRFVPLNRLLVKLYSTKGCQIEKRVNVLCALKALYQAHEEQLAPAIMGREDFRDSHHDLLKQLLEAMDDYTIDSRGDIGSIIRHAAIQAFPFLLPPSIRDADYTTFRHTYLGKLVRHLLDKLDKLRWESLTQLRTLHPGMLPYDELFGCLYDSGHFFQALWNYAGPLSVVLEGSNCYILEGLCSSAGSVNTLIAEPASKLLAHWLFSPTSPIGIEQALDHLRSRIVKGGLTQRTILHVLNRLLAWSLPDETFSTKHSHFTTLITSAMLPDPLFSIAQDAKLNMHDILTAIAVIQCLSKIAPIARDWIGSQGINHALPRVRESCLEFLNTNAPIAL